MTSNPRSIPPANYGPLLPAKRSPAVRTGYAVRFVTQIVGIGSISRFPRLFNFHAEFWDGGPPGVEYGFQVGYKSTLDRQSPLETLSGYFVKSFFALSR